MGSSAGYESVRESEASESKEARGDAGVATRWLSGFRGLQNHRGMPWRLRKAAALIKLLALAPDHRLHREQVMDLLWPELGRKAASNNLRQALHAARRTLDPIGCSRYLTSEDEPLVLCPGGTCGWT